MKKNNKLPIVTAVVLAIAPLIMASCTTTFGDKEKINHEKIEKEANELFKQIKIHYTHDKSQHYAKDVLIDDLKFDNPNPDFQIINIKLSNIANILKIEYSLKYIKSNLIFDSNSTYEITGFKKEKTSGIESNSETKIKFILNQNLEKISANYSGNKEISSLENIDDSLIEFNNFDSNDFNLIVESKSLNNDNLILVVKLQDKNTKILSESKSLSISGFLLNSDNNLSEQINNSKLVIENNGEFPSQISTLKIKFEPGISYKNATFQWYQDDILNEKLGNEQSITISSVDLYKDSNYYLKITYEENGDTKVYKTNSVLAHNFLTEEEKILENLKTLSIDFNGNKKSLRAEDVKDESLIFSNYDQNKYEAILISKRVNGKNLILKTKLRDKSTNLESVEKEITISGFLIKLPTTITEKLEASTLEISNNGYFLNNDQNLTISLTGIDNQEILNFSWYKNNELIADYSDKNLIVSSSEIKAKTEYFALITYQENNELKTYTTNSVFAYKFVPETEKIDLEIDKVKAKFIGNKSIVLAKDVENENIEYLNYNKDKYDVILLQKSYENSDLNLKIKLQDKNTKIESKEKDIIISGFSLREYTPITDIIKKTTIASSNKGYFESNDSNIVISPTLPLEIQGLKYQWYENGEPKYKSTSPNLIIKPNEISNTSEFYLKISYRENNQDKIYKTNSVILHKQNPLKNYKIRALNDGLLVDGSTQIILENTNGVADNDLYVQWFKNGIMFSDKFQNSANAYETGNYYAVIINSDGVKWQSNSVIISDLPNLNLNSSFASNFDNKTNITANSSKIIGYENRKANSKVYETELLNKYQAFGFRYPGYNFNYEGGGNLSNSYINFVENGQSRRINISSELLKERVKDQRQYKYNDPNWIKSEIANNRLKKHPFALNWFQKNVSDSTKSAIKEFQINTFMSGHNTSGLYATAGEVIEIQFDEKTYETYKALYSSGNSEINISFIINQNYWDNYPFNDTGRISNRYPFLRSEFKFRFNEISSDRKIKIASPFGGSISFYIYSPIYNANGMNQTVNFTIRNAVETINYVHNQTTKEQWDDQIKRYKNNEITAPVASLETTYSSIWLPFTSPNHLAGVNLDNIIYPKKIINKWADFYESSYLWNDYNGKKLALNYNDDVWGGALAWGGANYNLFAPISWGSKYIRGETDFDFDDWGNYHEVNHNFQDYQDPFNVKDHGWTNIPSTINLSFINDKTRHRSLINLDGQWSDGWARLSNLSAIVSHERSWYGFYATLIYAFGPLNFVDYTKASGRAGMHDKGVKTTKFLSDYFDFDLDYALRSFRHLLSNNKFKKALPPLKNNQIDETEYINQSNRIIQNLRNQISSLDTRIANAQETLNQNSADEEARADLELATRLKNERNTELNSELRKLASYEDRSFFAKDDALIAEMRKKMAIDFVANIYAVGSYRYIPSKNEYEYTSDTMPAFQIPAGSPYVFDFEKAITSLNPNFKFKEIRFAPRTKFGAKLSLDKQNPKKLIYEADPDFFDQIDEFDVDIIPDDFIGKPENYIPAYKYKIKVRNIVNKPSILVYDQLPEHSQTIASALEYIKNNDWKNKYTIIADDSNGSINYLRKERQLVQLKMKFIAPKTGSFDFMGSFDDFISISVNDQIISEINHDSQNEIKIGSYDFEKDKIYNITISVYNGWGAGKMNIRLKNNNEWYSLYEHSVSDALNTDEIPLQTLKSYLLDEKYKYKRRFKDYDSRFDIEYNKFIKSKQNEVSYTNEILSQYQPLGSHSTMDKISDNNYSTFLETWSTNYMKYKWTYDEPVLVNALDVTRKRVWYQAQYVPDYYKITVIDEYGNSSVVFDGKSDMKNYNEWTFRVKFNSLVKAKEIILEARRSEGNGLLISDMRFVIDNLNQNSLMSITNNKINYFGSWKFDNNDQQLGNSPINNKFISTNKANDYLTFELDKPNFTIYGKMGLDQSSFDIYINDKLIQKSISNFQNKESMNAPLYTHIFNNDLKSSNGKYIIKIVNKENKLLTLNYISYEKSK